MSAGEDRRDARELEPYRDLLRQFEAASSDRRPGAEVPTIDDFLGQVPQRDRESVRRALEATASRWASRVRGEDTASPAGDTETINPEAPAHVPPSAPGQRRSPSWPGGVDSTIAGTDPGSTAEAVDMFDTDPGDTRFFDAATGNSSPPSDVNHDETMDPAIDVRPPSKSGGLPGSFDDYEILQELGRGGMGVVYKAREKGTGRLVCVKMMLGGEYASEEALRRFQVETEAAAHLDHPNIVPIYRAGLVNGMPYFAMKFIDGRAMDSIDRNEFQEHPRKGVQLMAKICRAIDFAHSRGILHRDLKPANILLDQEGEPHITDFGLAKKMDDDSGQTRTGMIMGTPDYMSPEQAVGANALITVTTDIYSLGSILFDMLTGQPPFKSATIVETLSRVTKEPARTPTTLNRRVSKDLETICLKCLEKDPDKRFRSAALLADELDRFLRGEPIISRPVGTTERLWRWSRRNPGLAAMGAALLLMLCTVSVGSVIAAYQMNERRNEAVEARGEAEKARQRADEQTEVAKASALIAQQQRTLALDTLNNLVTKVEAKLRDRADLADLQQDVLQDALQGLQEVSRTAENSGRADRTIGVAHQRMADIQERLGKTAESTQEHRKAIAIFESLIQDDPLEDWARWNAAISYDKLADRQASADVDAASQLYRKSLALREQLAATSHDTELETSRRQRALLISAGKMGRLELQQGRPNEARKLFEKSLEQGQAMLEADPTNSQFKTTVAGFCALLGRVSFSLSDLQATHDYCHRSLALRQELHDEDPTSVTAATNLAGAYDALGDVELQTDQLLEAKGYYESAVTLLEGLYAKDATDADVKGNLSTLYYKLATTFLRLDDPDAAKPAYAKCLKLRDDLFQADPSDPNKQISVMLARARCGLHREAAEIAEQLQASAGENAGSLFFLACGYALAAGAAADSEDEQDQALQQAYTESAVHAIEQAIELGYRDMTALRTDPDLDPIRANAQFQAFLANLDKSPVE